MEHPFITDLSSKTLEEIQSTISDLSRKESFARRMGNSSLANQVVMVIESYRKEYQKRITEMIDKQKMNAKIDISKQ